MMPTKELADKINSNLNPKEKPLILNDPNRLSTDVVKEIYSFFPKELLSEIGVKKEKRNHRRN